MNYNLYSDEWTRMSGMAPVMTGMLEMLAPMTRGTAYDITPFLNILRFNKQDRPFWEADNGLSLNIRDAFRTGTAGQPSLTMGQALGRSLASYFLDDKGMAERALSSVADFHGGSIYAFGTGGRSLAEAYGRWDRERMGTYSGALSSMMSDIWNFGPDANITRGQRSALAAGMLRGDESLLRDYAEIRQAFRRNNVEWGGGWEGLADRARDGGLSQEMVTLAERVEKARKSIEDFGEAANNWGRVLKTDAVDAMQKVSSLLGGSAFSQFAGNEQALGDMALTIKHVGGLTGRGVDSSVAMVVQAGKMLQATGGPADTAFNVGTNAMLQSQGMEGYRVTRERADKMMLQYNAELQSSPAFASYFGGLQEYMERNIGGGKTVQQITSEWEDLMKGSEPTIENVNRILGTNYNLSDLRRRSRMNFARDAAAAPNNFSQMSYGNMRRDMLNKLSMATREESLSYDAINELSREAGTDVLELVNTNAETFDQRLSRIQDEGVRERVKAFRSTWERNVDWVANNTRLLGAFTGHSQNEIASAMSETSQRRYEALDRQSKMRTRISRGTSGAGLVKTITDIFRENPDVSLGDILAGVGDEGLPGEATMSVASLDMGKEDRDRFAENLKSVDPGFFRSLNDQFLKGMSKVEGKDDREGIARAAEALSLVGVRYENGKLSVGDMDAEELQTAVGEWRYSRSMREGERDTLIEALRGDKESDKLDVFDKMKIAGHNAMLDVAHRKVDNNEDTEGIYQEYIDAVMESATSGDRKESLRRIEAAYAKALPGRDEDFEQKQAGYMKTMGVSMDQAGLAPVMATMFKELLNRFVETFGEGGALRTVVTNN